MFYRRLCVFAAAVLFVVVTSSACGDEGTTEPDNRRPSASLSASPTLGFAPLDVDISLTCSDEDGSIAEYRLDADSVSDFEITRTSPIDTTLTFEEDTQLRGQCTDNDDAESFVATASITMRQEPTAALFGIERDDAPSP